jgi:ribosome-binding factor A
VFPAPKVTILGTVSSMVRPVKSPNRAQRVSDQIQRDLAELIAREVRDPRVGMVTISGVELTPDYAHAKVFFTVIGSDPAETALGLNAAAGHLHNLLFKRLRIHTVPRLTFVRDASLERGFAIDGLIREALRGSDRPGAAPESGAAPDADAK